MKTASLSLAAAVLLSTTSALTDYVKNNVRNSFGNDRVVRINKEFVNDDLRKLMERNAEELDHFGHHELGPEVKISKEAVRLLKEAEIDFEDTTESWIEHFESNFADPNFFCTDDDCASRDAQSFYQSYQTLEAIHARLDSLASSSNGLATTGSIGKSYQGRDLKTITIGDDGAKPIVFYQCNIHAREWLPPMYCTYMAETLLQGHSLLDTYTFVILPSLNPDGYVYSYTTNQNWRKTRKPNSGSSCIGTDGNRNWDSHHCGQGASTSPCSETYCGTVPFSEPETAAVRDWGLAHADRVFAFADIHSYGGYWMSPWGWTYSNPPAADFNKMRQCFQAAERAVEATNGYPFTSGSSANAIYIAAGGSDDWFYDALGVIYANSVECRGTSFQPAASNIMLSNTEIFNGMVAELECAASLDLGGSGGGSTPTSPPVSSPTSNGCVDSDPSGIQYTNGQPAPCNEIGSYCSVYDFVVEACPATCGACMKKVSSNVIASARVIEAPSAQKSNVVYFVAPIAAAVVGGVLAAMVIVNRRKNVAVEEAKVVEVQA